MAMHFDRSSDDRMNQQQAPPALPNLPRSPETFLAHHSDAERREGGEAIGPAAFSGKRGKEDYRFSGSSFFFSFFCLAGFSAFASAAFASAFFGFFSGSAGFSSAFDFSTSSRMAIRALSPTRFCTWAMRVYPPGRVLKRGAMVSKSLASAA